MLHVGLTPAMVPIPTVSTAQGTALALAGPPGGRFFVQFVWANTGPCVPPDTLSSSDALDTTIQPRS